MAAKPTPTSVRVVPPTNRTIKAANVTVLSRPPDRPSGEKLDPTVRKVGLTSVEPTSVEGTDVMPATPHSEAYNL